MLVKERSAFIGIGAATGLFKFSRLEPRLKVDRFELFSDLANTYGRLQR